jgi:uncharacterized protein YjdB
LIKSIFRLFSHLPLLLVIALGLQLSACGGGGSSSSTASPTVTGVQISFSESSLVDGLTTQAHAATLYSDNTSVDSSSSATDWYSSNSSVASIDNNGKITAVAPGTTKISAVVGDKIGSATLTVVQAQLVALQISPDTGTLPTGIQQQFSATGIYYNGSTNLSHDVTDQVTWSSSASSVLSISDTAGSKGLATSVSAGAANISASLNGISATSSVTVSIATLSRVEISASQSTVPTGANLQLTATGIFSDNTSLDLSSQVNWSSANTGIASVAASGLVTAVAGGTVNISLNYLGKSASFILTVSAATLSRIEITPARPGLIVGATEQFVATAIYADGTHMDVTDEATWSSSADAVASVGNTALDHGLVSAVATGSATITAYFGSQSKAVSISVTSATLQSLEISPSNPTIAAGTKQKFTATGHYSDGLTRDLTDQVVWASSTSSIAKTSGDTGYFSAVSTGTARITAALGSTVGFTDLTVSAATLSSITLSPTSVSIASGYTTQFSATGHFSDSSTQDITSAVIWQSSDPTVASIDNANNHGLLTALAAGSTTITASLSGKSQSTGVTVSTATLSSISIQLASSSMNAGTEQSATATAHYSDSSTLDVTSAVTWTSSDDSVALISNATNNNGLITAVGAGSTTLSATLDGVSASTTLNVTNNANAPVSLSLLASPNVILNDNSDTSTITITALPADSSGAVANGTVINVVVTDNGVTTPHTLQTTNGSASFTLKTANAGFITIDATVSGTTISTSGFVYATPSFANVIANIGYKNAVYDTTVTTKLLAGSWFALVVKNISNRSFNIDQYLFSNGGVSTPSPGSGISGGDLTSGEQYGLIVNLISDQTDSGISGKLSMSDTPTAQAFNISITFTP